MLFSKINSKSDKQQGNRKIANCTVFSAAHVGTTALGRPLCAKSACFWTVEGDRPYQGLRILTTNLFLCDCPVINKSTLETMRQYDAGAKM